MNATFKVQNVNIEGKRAYVRASVVKPCNFVVSSGSILGASDYYLKVMEPERGVFLFRLEHPADRFRLKIAILSTLDIAFVGMFDDIISECRENAKPFHEREISRRHHERCGPNPNL